MIDVSIIIVNWNTQEILRDCLASIIVNTHNVEYEIIVVDNASSDGSVQMLKNDFPQIRLIANTDNRGFAAANNQAMVVARGRYYLLLNSDTVILGDVIANSIQFADTDDTIAVMGCRILNPDRTLQPSCFMFPSLLNMLLSATYLYKLLPDSRFFGREQMTWWNRDDTCQVDVVTGCFMLVRRKAVEQVGVMDEDFFMYGEETDWCYRFKEQGWKNVFSPVGEIIHLGGSSSAKIKPQMRLQLRGSILLFFKKHRNRLSYSCACILVGLFFAIRIPWWIVKGACSRNQRDCAFEKAHTYLRGSRYCFTNPMQLLKKQPFSRD